MLDDFFVRALVAGLGLAVVSGPLGCFVVWRRMSYLGDTMAHSALLGVALSYMFKLNLTLGVLGVSLMVSFALLALQKRHTISTDALLGILSHSSLALGVVLIGLMSGLRIDLMGFMFGDILSVSRVDIAVIYGGGAVVLGILLWIWRALLASTVSEELAASEGLDPARSQVIMTLLMACTIAIAMNLIGILLITALLIIPATTARCFASTPERMAVYASIVGALSVLGGLWGSMKFDSPSGPSVVVAALVLFLVAFTVTSRKKIER
ncbi:metal ABC transporter permease [Flexibacterium corallicola]|uniref:metal ABC transporter permease n=1 Tax=Flexibacterium corallicola TaxID=3037259 RepID=UPI00286F9092|nr:metal ABC transporter permease [Pseudovibrio sp. M1P-2-3]